ncbi:MAG: tyrosine-type recombinase/integrase [Candidatus Dormibacteria bacterium]
MFPPDRGPDPAQSAAAPPHAVGTKVTPLPLGDLPEAVPEILSLAAEAATDPDAAPEVAVLGRFLLRHTPATAEEYARDLRSFARWCKARGKGLLDVDRTTVEVWVLSLRGQGIRPRTIRRRLAALHSYYLEAVDAGVIERVPTLRVKRPAVQEPAKAGLSREDAASLLEAAGEAGPRDEALVRLLLLNGLRVSEAIGLRCGDLGHERGHRTVGVHRKGDKRTVEALSPATAYAIDRLLEVRGEIGDEDWLFVTADGERLSRHAAARVTMRLGRAIGCDEALNPHELRHSFITLGLDAGASLRDMQRAAAHADPRTTADYDRRRKALDTHPSYLVERYLS